MSLVNLRALPLASGSYWAETGPLVVRLVSERALVATESAPFDPNASFVVVANPEFGHGDRGFTVSLRDLDVRRGGTPSDLGTLPPLPAAIAEAEGIVQRARK